MNSNEKERSVICDLCSKGSLWGICDEYIRSCAQKPTDTKQKNCSRFPNLAGLCRYLGTGLDDLRMLKESFPSDYDRLLAIFEDEALNFEISGTILSSYMKKRLLFCSDDEPKNQKQVPRVSFCFEHDIYADGE